MTEALAVAQGTTTSHITAGNAAKWEPYGEKTQMSYDDCNWQQRKNVSIPQPFGIKDPASFALLVQIQIFVSLGNR